MMNKLAILLAIPINILVVLIWKEKDPMIQTQLFGIQIALLIIQLIAFYYSFKERK